MPGETKTTRRQLRVNPADDALFRKAAAAVGESVSGFLVESARTRAEIVLADRTEFALDAESWKQFSDALDRPARVNPAVADLMGRRRPE